MADTPQLLLENQLCFPLYAAARRVTNLYTPHLKPLDLTYTQYIVLLVLWERDHISVGELSERLLLDSGTLTPLLKKMEAAGRVTRTRSSQDERVVIISLTDEGRALREKAADIPFKVGSCIPLEAEDAVLLHQLLNKLLQATALIP